MYSDDDNFFMLRKCVLGRAKGNRAEPSALEEATDKVGKVVGATIYQKRGVQKFGGPPTLFSVLHWDH